MLLTKLGNRLDLDVLRFSHSKFYSLKMYLRQQVENASEEKRCGDDNKASWRVL